MTLMEAMSAVSITYTLSKVHALECFVTGGNYVILLHRRVTNTALVQLLLIALRDQRAINKRWDSRVITTLGVLTNLELNYRAASVANRIDKIVGLGRHLDHTGLYSP